MLSSILACVAAALPPADDELPVLRVTSDDVEIVQSCRVEIPPGTSIRDEGEPGVLHVRVPGVRVVFGEGSVLDGGAWRSSANTDRGTGLRIHGVAGVRIENARVRDFAIGIHASEADDLQLVGCDVSDNLRQRLRSTAERADDGADWLDAHDNTPGGEGVHVVGGPGGVDRRWHARPGRWAQRYGAGILVERSCGVTVRDCRARRTQNGLILDRVTDSFVYDNDFSFLSGWGLALWRASDNVITRNALDFCIRGYSHGVYNRGQDSAGLLMFEQCSRNVIAENSITHGGDGIFGFAGREALGETGLSADDLREQDIRGCADNLFVGNDLSYAAAHGLELTFSGGNVVRDNRFVGNAICGLWAGYTRDMLVEGNHFADNGEAGYGLERGGVNAEHAQRLLVRGNTFAGDACGVHLWWDADEHLAELPWAGAHGFACADNAVLDNRFVGGAVGVQLRDADDTRLHGNTFDDVAEPLLVEGPAPVEDDTPPALSSRVPELVVLGDTRPVGARRHLGGREAILMGPRGPWDHEDPLLRLVETHPTRHVWEYRDPDGDPIVLLRETGGGSGGVSMTHEGERIVVEWTPDGLGQQRYELDAPHRRRPLFDSGRFEHLGWQVRVFPWSVDPREDVAAFRAAAEGPDAVHVELPTLSLGYHGGGPADVPLIARAHAALGDDAPALPGGDGFGTRAETRVPLRGGTWRLRTMSDDGLRVWVDGALLIDDWTWHPPKEHVVEFRVPHGERGQAGEVDLRVEHFELDGWALLEVQLERVPPAGLR